MLDALRLALCIFTGCISGLVAYIQYYYTDLSGDPTVIVSFFQAPDDRYFHLSLLGGLIFANVTFLIEGRSIKGNHWDLLRQAAVCWGLTLLIMLGMLFLLKTSQNFSRGLMIVWAAYGLLFLFLARVLEKKIAAALTHSGLNQRWIAIVGATHQAERLVRRLAMPDLADGHRIVGIFDDQGRWDRDIDSTIPVSGNLEDLRVLCRSEHLDAIILAFPGHETDRIRDVADELRALPTDLLLGPDLAQIELQTHATPRLGPLPVVSLAQAPLRDWSSVLKWLEDMMLSVFAIIFFSPLLLLIAIAIKIDSPGPVLFRQRRFGFNNREFTVLKFRTMHQGLCDISGEMATQRNDRRVTRVGRILRRASLDELPQLFNVLRGEMSIVGPRAHPVSMRLGDKLIHDQIRDYAARHRVKPGITGLAQVNGNRGEVQNHERAEQRIEFDLFYIDNWNVWLDLEILLRTVFMVPFDRSAY